MQIVGDRALIQKAVGAAHVTMAAPCTLLVWMLLPCLYEIESHFSRQPASVLVETDLLVHQIIFF